jgi:ribonuclease R
MRQKILQVLRENPSGLTLQSLARRLQLLQREKPLLKQKLGELEKRGLVLRVKRLYMLLPETRILRGRVVRVAPTFLFVRPFEKNGPDVFVPGRFAEGAVLGDEVELVWQDVKSRPGPDGKVLRILKSRKNSLVGFYHAWAGRPYFLPQETASSEEIPLTGPLPSALEEGMVVEMGRESRRIVRVLGRLEDPGIDLSLIVSKYDLPEAFSPACLAEAEATALSGLELTEDRVDLREWPAATIDGEDARDFDDAVSIQEQPQGGYLLGVHIADVSFFVQPGSCLDREAFLRGTSIYFPEKALPMLPEKLSCGACSLKPGLDRMTVSVLMDIDEQGLLRKTRIQPSMLRSAARLTYTEVNDFLAGEAAQPDFSGGHLPDLRMMGRLAALLRRNRMTAGSLDFSHPEPRLRYEKGKLVEVEAFLPGEAHGIIEEFMLAANQAVAVYLAAKSVPFVYRIHPPPALKDLKSLKQRLAFFGIGLPEPEKIDTRSLKKAQEQAFNLPEAKFISLQILKSLQLARYSPENIGHFGLGFNLYTHFTSPIRRYPDLMVHRTLKRVWADRGVESPPLDSVSRLCSERERRAEAAENELVQWRIYRFLKSRLGDELTGWVADITSAGLVIELEDLFVTGIILFQDLGGDYFVRDTDVSLKGRSTGKTFHMGERMRVVMAAVDPLQLRLTLIPAETSA